MSTMTRKQCFYGGALALALAAACVAACSMGDMPGGGAAPDRSLSPVRFASDSIAPARDGAVRRARVADDKWVSGDAIGVYMVDHPTTPILAAMAENIKYTTASTEDTGGFTTEEANTIYYPLNGDTVDFIAYYPHQDSFGTDWIYELDVSSAHQDDQSQIDLMWAGRVNNGGAGYDKNYSGTVNLAFAHKLVKLVFNISKDDSVATGLTDLTVGITEQATTGTMDLSGDNGDDVTPTNSGETILAKITGNESALVNAEAIVFPATDNTSVRFKFENTEHEIFTGAVPNPGNGWTAGNKYTYNVTLKKNEAVITGEITPWGPGIGGDVTADAAE